MYIVIMEKLRAGDILLTSEKAFTSKFIRTMTKSDYSHAILYVGYGSYIHSDTKGVHSGNIQRLLFDNPDDIKVLRVYEPNVADLACIFARTQIGKNIQ